MKLEVSELNQHRAKTSLSVWSLALLGGTLATLLANTFLHFFPAAQSHAIGLSGMLIATNGSAETIDLLPLGDRRSGASISMQSRLLSSTEEKSAPGTLGVGVDDAYWDSSRHQFWATSNLTNTKSEIIDSEIVILNGRGEILRSAFINHDEYLSTPTINPRSSILSYQVRTRDGKSHLAVVDTVTAKARRIASTSYSARWSNDGHQLVYACFPSAGSPQVCTYSLLTNTETVVPILAYDDVRSPSFSPNGKQIIMAATSGPGITPAIIIVDARTGTVVSSNRAVQAVDYPTWSPDGRFVAYSGPNGIYVCDRELQDCSLVLRGTFTNLQWTRDDIHAFGLP